MFSIYSIATSVLFYNLSLIILFFLRRKTNFLAQYTISTLLFLALLSFIRLLLPVDLELAYVVRSERILPKLIELLGYKPSFLPVSVGVALLVVWGVGTTIYMVKDTRTEIKAYKARKRYLCVTSTQVQQVLNSFDVDYVVKVSPMVCMPYTVGIIKPVIYLPLMNLSDEELYYVLKHEIQHIKSHDNVKRLVFLIIEALFWWNPIAHMSLNEFEMLIEMQCDAKLTSTLDGDEVKKYLQTLISVMKQVQSSEDRQTTKLAISFAQTYSIKQRFEVLLLRKNRKPKYMRYLVCCVMLCIFILSYFVIIQAYYPMPTVAQDFEFTFESDNTFILIDDGTPYLVWGGERVENLTGQDLSNPPYSSLEIIGG